MKTKKILLFITANLLAVVLITAVIARKNQQKKFGERFRPHAFIINDSVTIDADVESVYDFYVHHYHEIYSQTAKKHREFKLMNSKTIQAGLEIYCVEGDDNEMVYHNYIVHKIVPNKLIYKSSEPSTVKVKTKNGTTKSKCNAFVYVDFEQPVPHQTKLKFTIVIQMPNYLYKVAGQIMGGKKAKEEWENHLGEELEGFRKIYYHSKNYVQNK
jgi:hypothetical protein